MVNQKLKHCREIMEKLGATALFVPTSDPHGSEFIGPSYQLRQFLSDFTGSAGSLLILKDKAYLWTDGRYYLQAKQQLANNGIELMKDGMPNVPTVYSYIAENLREEDVLAYNPLHVSIEQAWYFSKTKASILARTDIDQLIWPQKPEPTYNEIYDYPITYCGAAYKFKIEQVRFAMSKAGCQYYLVSHLDENAWLFNLRGSDLEQTPVFYSFSLITPNSVILFVNTKKLKSQNLCRKSVIIKEYDEVWEHLEGLRNANIFMDPATCCHLAYMKLHPSCTPVFKSSIIDELKAIKNHVEQRQMKEAAVDDGLAVSKVLMELEKQTPTNLTDEFSISQRLLEERGKIKDFKSVSFDTIAGFKENGAIIHYQPPKANSKKLEGSGLVLIDSGGQYLRGTTDITRTVPLGEITEEMVRCYTAVLAAHLALFSHKFPYGTLGRELDEICRNRLAEFGYSYAHGTGHGFGHFLSVHEGPHGFSRGVNGQHEILPGSCTTIEPGVYLEGKLGIRLENQVLCRADSDMENTLCLEAITLCPWERRLIDPALLKDQELEALNQYHEQVRTKLLAATDDPALIQWITDKCKPIYK